VTVGGGHNHHWHRNNNVFVEDVIYEEPMIDPFYGDPFLDGGMIVDGPIIEEVIDERVRPVSLNQIVRTNTRTCRH